MAHIFLDESGQFSNHKDDEYFVVGSFITGNPRRTEKQFRSWQRRKFPKRMRYQPEIKFSDVRIVDDLCLRTLKHVSNLDVRIHYSYLRRKNIPDKFHYKEKLKSGHLYTYIIAETLKMYLPIDDIEFRIFCDQRHLKGVTRNKFKSELRSHLLPLLPKDSIFQIEMLNSANAPNVQIADWITGALAAYLEGKKLGEEFYTILKNNFLGEGKEMFKDHWEQKIDKQKTQPGS